MKCVFEKNIPNLEYSLKIAREIYAQYVQGLDSATLFFEGGLGVGKTYFIREILKAAGVTQDITSPTYTLVQEYSTPYHNQVRKKRKKFLLNYIF